MGYKRHLFFVEKGILIGSYSGPKTFFLEGGGACLNCLANEVAIYFRGLNNLGQQLREWIKLVVGAYFLIKMIITLPSHMFYLSSIFVLPRMHFDRADPGNYLIH